MISEGLSVLFQDEYLVAVNKPAGMLVHRSKMDARATVFAMQTLRDQIGQHVYPLHRLDKPTSGVLLFAKDPDSARSMSMAIQAHEVRKTYTAIVRGWTAPEELIDYALQERLDKTTDSKARQDKPPQEAQTAFKTLGKAELSRAVGRYPTARYSLLELTPKTGRKHQIRRHLKHIFHPIIGDRKYGDRDHNAFFLSSLDISRLLLAATELAFHHPITGKDVQINAPNDFPIELMELFAVDSPYSG